MPAIRARADLVLLAAGLAVTLLGSIAAVHLTRRRLHLQALTRELLEEVAERRNSEQRLSQSEARYRVLVENSPDAILLHNHGRIVFANGATVRPLAPGSSDELDRQICVRLHASRPP